MVRHPILLLPNGRSATTPAEREMAQALIRHGAARSQLGKAVERERATASGLWAALKRRGSPEHTDVEGARCAWREAVAAKKAAATEVEAADEHLNTALVRWQSESAQWFSQGTASHG